MHVYYKSTHIKQYHKENRALRPETTINNTYDFGIGKRLHNLPMLARSALPPIAGSVPWNEQVTTARLPRGPSRPSTPRSSPATSAPQAFASPMRALMRSCTRSSCSALAP